MPTKTDRILSYLPGTFQTAPRPPALYAVADTFGNELLLGENSLSAVMLSHWVDFADLNAEAILDLASIASLYGLAPRDDETVEEFRDHLKRYVRTFLEGTATVQGVLRVTAEALGLRIADSYDDLDSWWKHKQETLVTVRARRDDAASLLFGFEARKAVGSPVQPAMIAGNVDLSSINLPQPLTLRLKVNGSGQKEAHFAAGPSTLDTIVSAINAAAGVAVASARDASVALASPTAGKTSRLELPDGPDDAAPALLGVAPRVYNGSPIFRAVVRGTADLGAGADLSHFRYLRLVVDTTHFAEVDCAGSDAAHTNLDHVVQAINGALGVQAAGRDGGALVLASPTLGFKSMIAVQQATAQDASTLLLGSAPRVQLGGDPRPARALGLKDLGGGVDLSQSSNVRLRIDGVARTVDCTGANPSQTQAFEIITAINDAFRASIARADGGAIAIASLNTGPASEVAFETAPSGDATEAIFGIGSRVFQGADALPAVIAGSLDLSHGADLMARDSLSISIEDGNFVEVDLRSAAVDPRAVTLHELRDAINNKLKTVVAGDDGTHLTLTSPSAVEVQPLETLVRRKFVTRATVTDEAAQAVFGFVGSDAQSIPGSPAELIGTVDLSRGVDLRDGRFLRIAVDNQAPRDIDCAGPRARATVLDEAVAAINAVLPKTASHDGQRLILTARKRILVDARVSDALERLLGILPGAIRGQDATRVSFVSTVDLTAGIALPANASIKIGVDAVAPVEINLAGPQPANRSTGEVAAAINQALQSFYCTVGAKGLIVNSRVLGAESRIEFEAPGGADATSAIFGITAPRVYQGEAALPPEVVGSPDLSGALDLRALRFLRVAIDGAPARDIDCAAASADASAVSLDSIVKAINDQLGKPVASAIGAHLRLSSAALRFEPHTSGSAALKLLGIAQGEATAADATPATIAGLASLPEPFDLSRRPLIRISVNGGRPVDIAAAGPNPSSTSRDEVVAAINRVIPGLASITDDDRVRLSAGDTLSLVPLRYIELLEYPSETAEDSERRLRAGDGWFEINDGAAAAEVSIELTAPFGLAVPTFVNRTSGTIFRVFSNLIAGDTLRVSPDGAEITSAAGERRQVDAGSVQAGPLGSQVHVPFADEWSLNGVPPELQLNDPAAARIVILRARLEDHGYSDVRVTVSAQASGGLFDAVVRSGDVEERYTGVTIGADDGPRSLARQINAGASFGKSSRFVKAEEFAKASALEVPQGRSDWVYLESITARYNHARFNVDRFPGGRSIEPGVFNVSRFANSPPEKGVSVFAPASDFQDVTAVVKFRSERNRPGVFAVNLPADLPSRFGAKFNESRFGEAAGGPETYNQAVTEPESDPQHIKNLINGQPSDFVTAAIVPRVPLGFSPVRIPFRRPRFLSLGDASRPAQIFLAEEGIQGFLALAAKEHGAYGNDIAVTARKSGPAKFDFSIVYRGGRFENAREVARGQALSASVTALSQSSPAGVLEAKAAGVRAIVTREDTQNTFTAQL